MHTRAAGTYPLPAGWLLSPSTLYHATLPLLPLPTTAYFLPSCHTLACSLPPLSHALSLMPSLPAWVVVCLPFMGLHLHASPSLSLLISSLSLSLPFPLILPPATGFLYFLTCHTGFHFCDVLGQWRLAPFKLCHPFTSSLSHCLAFPHTSTPHPLYLLSHHACKPFALLLCALSVPLFTSLPTQPHWTSGTFPTALSLSSLCLAMPF